MAYAGTLEGILGAGGSNNLVTTLYTGDASARSLTTGQNLAGGGLVWIKARSSDISHVLFDTARGAQNLLGSNTTSAQQVVSGAAQSFNSNGFTIGTSSVTSSNGTDFVMWSFLKKAGFMDIVSWTGNGSSPRAINHSLIATPHLMIVKNASTSQSWFVYHNALGDAAYLTLNSTAAVATGQSDWGNTSPTSTQFTVGSNLNQPGQTYIAYLFAHNPAQKIFCGTFTTDGSGNATVTGLGFRPKWLLVKPTIAGNWILVDATRGWGSGDDKELYPNQNTSEETRNMGSPTADGFTWSKTPSVTNVFIAIG